MAFPDEAYVDPDLGYHAWRVTRCFNDCLALGFQSYDGIVHGEQLGVLMIVWRLGFNPMMGLCMVSN